MESSISSYGHNNNYFQISGRIVTISDPENTYACHPLKEIFSKTDETFFGYLPVVLVERGGCSIVTKVRNIQKAFGYTVLVINDSNDRLEAEFQDDDGTSGYIYIPAVMITKKDGQIIKDFIMENKDNPDKLGILVFDKFSTL